MRIRNPGAAMLFIFTLVVFFALNPGRARVAASIGETGFNILFALVTIATVASGYLFLKGLGLQYESRFNTIRHVMSHTSYKIVFAIILVLYFTFNIWINEFDEIVGGILAYNLAFVVPFLGLAVLTGIGIAMSLTLVAYKFKQVMSFQKEAGMTAVGGFLGLLGGACPGCFVGLLPSLAGVFGLTITLGSLPFAGFELQVPTFFLVGATLYWVSNPLTCNPDIKLDKGEKHE